MVGLQLALPSPGPGAPAAGLAARRMKLVAPPDATNAKSLLAVVLAAPVFAPDRQPGDAGGAAGGATMAGYAALGAATGGGFATAVVSAPGGKIESLRLGDAIDQWKLVGLSRTRLTFERSGVRQDLVVGAASAPPPSQTQADQ